jgi:hypothetical protein
MLFGPDHAVLPAVIEKLESTPIHQPATASFRAGKATETPTV